MDTLGKGKISLPTDILTNSTTPLLLIYLEGKTPLNCVYAINVTIGDALIQHTCFWVLSMTTYKTSVRREGRVEADQQNSQPKKFWRLGRSMIKRLGILIRRYLRNMEFLPQQ